MDDVPVDEWSRLLGFYAYEASMAELRADGVVR